MFGPGVGRVLDFLFTNMNFDMRLAGNEKSYSGAVGLFEDISDQGGLRSFFSQSGIDCLITKDLKDHEG